MKYLLIIIASVTFFVVVGITAVERGQGHGDGHD